MDEFPSPTRFLFFTGKGGVGKTSIACATAIHLADQGKKVLLVSTDPASNLDEVLGMDLSHHPKEISQVPGLWGLNLDPEQIAGEYRERVIGPYRNLLPESAVRSMEEHLSGSCTVEIAAFEEFSKLLSDSQSNRQYEHIVFDTAPTGHTLRLLSLPAAWSGFIETNTSGTSCLGPLSGLAAQRETYQAAVEHLKDPTLTTLILVARAEPVALREAARANRELSSLGMQNQFLVINAKFSAVDRNDPVAVAMEKKSEDALARMPQELRELPTATFPLTAGNMVGIDSLRSLYRREKMAVIAPAARQEVTGMVSLDRLLEKLATSNHGVVLTMGKGGVGKTSIACEVALRLAHHGYPVHLTTTDPAAHLDSGLAGVSTPNLTVTRIDPVVETALYTKEVLQSSGASLDENGRALLEEDLRSPCTEEIAVFRAFARAVEAGKNRWVVIDTAPTGHTILLLDAALSYHREVLRQSSQLPASVQQLLPRLRDRDYTHILIVTLPEPTPVHEAFSLQRDLKRAGIEPYAWIVNQSLTPLNVTDPLLRIKQSDEMKYLREVLELAHCPVAMISYRV